LIALKSQERTNKIDSLQVYGDFHSSKYSGDEEELILQQTSPAPEMPVVEQTVSAKDYVTATLTAWNNCPGIVKKQLDKQA